jgi:hypothetical protein
MNTTALPGKWPDSENPASVTTVNPKPADGNDDHHGTTESTEETTTEQANEEAEKETTNSSNLPFTFRLLL